MFEDFFIWFFGHAYDFGVWLLDTAWGLTKLLLGLAVFIIVGCIPIALSHLFSQIMKEIEGNDDD